MKIEVKDINFYYGGFHALKNISMEVEQNKVVAFIGPSGCGKSTFLRLFNRMNDLIPDTRLTGQILIDGKDIYAPNIEVDELRKEVGMVFQRPNPFPKSIFENVAYGLRVNGVKDKDFIAHRVEETLRGAALWDEVKNASFVIVPSECEENNPMTIIEGYAYGKPVIGSSLGGIPEIIEEGKTGFVFNAFDKDALASAIRRASQVSPEHYTEMSRNARRFAETHFGPEVHYNALMQIYEEAINRHKQTRP